MLKVGQTKTKEYARRSSRWLIRQLWRGWTNSIGSSTVMMWPLMRLLISSIMAASEVDFPDPVLPVTRIRPLLERHSWCTAGGIFSCSSVRALEGIARNTAPMPAICRSTLTRKRPWPGERVGEVGAVMRFEALDRLARHDFVERLLDEVGRQHRLAQWCQVAVAADARRIARRSGAGRIPCA